MKGRWVVHLGFYNFFFFFDFPTGQRRVSAGGRRVPPDGLVGRAEASHCLILKLYKIGEKKKCTQQFLLFNGEEPS